MKSSALLETVDNRKLLDEKDALAANDGTSFSICGISLTKQTVNYPVRMNLVRLPKWEKVCVGLSILG